MQKQNLAPKIKSLLEASNQFYQEILGYKPEQTSLQQIPETEWNDFAQTKGLNPNSSGIYLPRNQTAIIRNEEPLSVFHEYFGHGLYCEQSLSGRKLVDLEKKLLEEEKQEFSKSKFTLEDVQRFRVGNKNFQELDKFRKQNLLQYETFAIWTEYLLSGENGLKDLFGRKYDSLEGQDEEIIDSAINFSEQHGNLATFYNFGLARKTTPKRVKRLLDDIYGNKINKSKLILLTGSKKPFSDIDLFSSSNYLCSTQNNWLDLINFNEKDFERRIKLFEVQVTHPIFNGEFVAGDRKYLLEKRKQLKEQPITKEAIEYNYKSSIEQKERAFNFPKDSNERKIGLSYSKTDLANALALKKGLRLFTKEDLIRYSQNENFIELKGGNK